MKRGPGRRVEVAGSSSCVSDAKSVCVCERSWGVMVFCVHKKMAVIKHAFGDIPSTFLAFSCHCLLLLIQSTRVWINTHLSDRRRMVLIQFEYLRGTLCIKSKNHMAAACSSFSAITLEKLSLIKHTVSDSAHVSWTTSAANMAASLYAPRAGRGITAAPAMTSKTPPRRTQVTDRRGGRPM